MTEADLAALTLTLKLALVTTAFLLLIGTPLAWWLAFSRWRFRFLAEGALALPLVLPPTVLGFYLLIAFAPNSGFGQWLHGWGLPPLAFSFEGLVVASVIYSLPFMVQPLQAAFRGVDKQTLAFAATLGCSPWKRFWRIALPLARPGLITGMVLSFAHTLGEFGVVLMIGGNLNGETRVASIAIYEHVETLNYAGANSLSLTLLILSFLLLSAVYWTQNQSRRRGY